MKNHRPNNEYYRPDHSSVPAHSRSFSEGHQAFNKMLEVLCKSIASTDTPVTNIILNLAWNIYVDLPDFILACCKRLEIWRPF